MRKPHTIRLVLRLSISYYNLIAGKVQFRISMRTMDILAARGRGGTLDFTIRRAKISYPGLVFAC